MSQEIKLTAGISYYNPNVMGQATGKAVTDLTINQATPGYVEGTMSASTLGTAIPLGSVTAPHCGYLRNNDSTNFVQISNGIAGAVVGRLQAKEEAPFFFDPACVPYIKANTAPVSVDYLICNL